MTALGALIRKHHDEIVALWTHQARQAAAARGLDRPEFQNIIPTYLVALADAGDDLGRFRGRQRELLEKHLSARIRQGFPVAQIVDEISLLGRCIAAMWNAGRGLEPPGHLEVEKLFEELQLASAAVTELFTHHMLEDEQVEKQFLRLIRTMASESLKEGAPPLEERLKEVLHLIMEVMGAQSAALLLFNPETRQLEMSASVGAADAELERYAGSLDAPSFAEIVAGQEEATSLWDAESTELTVSESLRRSGIHSLLGVRLPPRRRLLGVMYIGVTERRAFTAREVHRLESLGEQLTVHLDNAKLYADLHDHIRDLNSERELRERFVSVLAHDLRGPLSAARMNAQLLIAHPERLDARRELAVKIDRNIERTDQMIRDLLDANRIRAGQRLPLRIDECSLSAVARDVFEGLVATYGDRFTLRAEERVTGYWSFDELRRALWNLGTNAVKYGAADQPITLTVKRTADGAQASVHNWGPPIPEEDQKELFRPFSRTHAAVVGGQVGWGLGLALVHGCAEAHGGRVHVESTKEAGTTFTLELPRDSRPFQPNADEARSRP